MQATEDLVQFSSGPEAFEWAEEILARDPTETQMARLRRRKRGYGRQSVEELRDQALTIVTVVARTQPACAARAFQFVFGRDNDVIAQDLIDCLVRHLAPIIVGKHPARSVALISQVLRGYRRHVQQNKKQTAVELAQAMGIGRQSYYEGSWFRITDSARQAMALWVEQATRSIDTELAQKGFFG